MNPVPPYVENERKLVKQNKLCEKKHSIYTKKKYR